MWEMKNIWNQSTILLPQSLPLPGAPKMAAGVSVTKAQPHGVGARGREGRTPKGQGGHTQLKAPHPVQGGAVPGRGARGGGGREGTRE